MGIVEVLEISGGRSPLIIEDLDVYPQLPDATGAPTLNSEEPVKRGLHHDYRRLGEELATVRGRIDIKGTVATRSAVRGRLVCEFDEYEVDTPHNRVLKMVIILLIRNGQITGPRKAALRRLLPHLDEVTLVSPESIRWATLTYHRADGAQRSWTGWWQCGP